MPSQATAGPRPGGFWTIQPEWRGETAFVIAGGPSVLTQNIERLRGRKVIAINSSCYCAPWADFLFFMDARWWRDNRVGCDSFQGRPVSTAAVPDPRVLRLDRILPEHGFATAPHQVMGRRTTLSLVLNALAHLAPRKIVLLGADGKFGSDGRRNHHAPHRWAHRGGTWDDQRAELQLTVAPLAALGIEVINASPGSALSFWPVVTLGDVL